MRQRAGEADDRRLCRDDVRAPRCARVCGQTADIDDGAGVALAQQRQRGLHAMERTVDAHRLRLAPIGVGQIGERDFTANCGVVDDDVELAEPLGDRVDHRIDALRCVMSAGTSNASPPRAAISSTTAWPSSRLARTFTATLAPAPARPSAIARPMLRPAPVTSATRSLER